MNKRMLIISPYFPPTNAADMHRIRTSLPYYAHHDWKAEVVAVDLQHSDMICDELLLKTLPVDTIIHRVGALKKSLTRKVGLGSIALRSLPFYFFRVNKLLRSKRYDLIFFSTTQFPLLILAVYWKYRHDVKIVFDIQDPWRTEYYRNKPVIERPKKYLFSYHLNKLLEPIAMKAADGLMSVSQAYVDSLQKRYPLLKNKPAAVVPFGMHIQDLDIARAANTNAQNNRFWKAKFNLVYIGRGGYDLVTALERLLGAIRIGIANAPLVFNKLHVHLLGTSYAAAGEGHSTFSKAIELAGLTVHFTENTDRLPFYNTLNTLVSADMLLIPGPDDPAFIPSKIFPYLLVERPILAILHAACPAIPILRDCDRAHVFELGEDPNVASSDIYKYLKKAMESPEKAWTENSTRFKNYSSEALTALQTTLFDKVCSTGI